MESFIRGAILGCMKRVVMRVSDDGVIRVVIRGILRGIIRRVTRRCIDRVPVERVEIRKISGRYAALKTLVPETARTTRRGEKKKGTRVAQRIEREPPAVIRGVIREVVKKRHTPVAQRIERASGRLLCCRAGTAWYPT